MTNIDLITSDTVVAELKEVVKRKLKSLKPENMRIALEEIEESRFRDRKTLELV